MTIIIIILLVTGGLLLGSFFNVLIYRLPRNESIVWPPSHCPSCNRRIKVLENIPILSYIFLLGKCRGCGKPISPQYPLVEAATSIATLLAGVFYLQPALQAGLHWAHLVPAFLSMLALLLLIPMALIDWRHFIIPDLFSIGLLILGIGIAFIPGGITPLGALAGILTGGGTLFLSGLIAEKVLKKKEAMGVGDIKLMAAIGSIFGWETALLSIILGAFIGAAAGLSLLAAKKLDQDHRIPFGPFLAAGVWLSVFWGRQLIGIYTRSFF
jgi:leader peptidase (prepilin peptidase)/N-methyltransferase